jgi:hypothetical protein
MMLANCILAVYLSELFNFFLTSRIYNPRRLADIQIILNKLDTMTHPIHYNAYQDDNQYRSLERQSKQAIVNKFFYVL